MENQSKQTTAHFAELMLLVLKGIVQISDAIDHLKQQPGFSDPTRLGQRWQELTEWCNQLPELSKNASAKAAEQGWYFGLDTSLEDVHNQILKIQFADGDALDLVMADYSREHMSCQLGRLYFRYSRDFLPVY